MGKEGIRYQVSGIRYQAGYDNNGDTLTSLLVFGSSWGAGDGVIIIISEGNVTKVKY